MTLPKAPPRATKLVHGGVRYLAQGNIALVREALHERTTLLRNAPHLAQPLAPSSCPRTRCGRRRSGVGLKMYDALAGRGWPWAHGNSRAHGNTALPAHGAPTGSKGGVKYWDGQFDDARLANAGARPRAGALLVNYCPGARPAAAEAASWLAWSAGC